MDLIGGWRARAGETLCELDVPIVTGRIQYGACCIIREKPLMTHPCTTPFIGFCLKGESAAGCKSMGMRDSRSNARMGSSREIGQTNEGTIRRVSSSR